MTASIDTDGFAALDKAFEGFHPKYRKKVVSPAIKGGMKAIVLTDAKRTTPKGETRQLFKSLKVRVAKGKGNKRLPRGVIGFAVVSAKTKRIDAYYSGWVFLGAKNRDGTKRPGTRTLRKALYSNSSAWKAYTVGKMKSGLPSVVREVRMESLRYKDK